MKLNVHLPLSSTTEHRTFIYLVVYFPTYLQVVYDVDGFCERNRDVLFTDLVVLMQSSTK